MSALPSVFQLVLGEPGCRLWSARGLLSLLRAALPATVLLGAWVLPAVWPESLQGEKVAAGYRVALWPLAVVQPLSRSCVLGHL